MASDRREPEPSGWLHTRMCLLRPTNSSNALSERFIWIFIALSPVAWDLLTISLFKHAFGQTLPGLAGWLEWTVKY